MKPDAVSSVSNALTRKRKSYERKELRRPVELFDSCMTAWRITSACSIALEKEVNTKEEFYVTATHRHSGYRVLCA
jgi:hypothetical protein